MNRRRLLGFSALALTLGPGALRAQDPRRFHARAARPAPRADRALSRRSAVADPDGRDLSPGGGRGGALDAGQPQPQGRRRGPGGQGQGLGRQREVAGRLPADAGDDEQPPRLDPEDRRRDDRPAEGRGRFHPAPARQGGRGRQPQDHAAAEGHDADDGGGRRSAIVIEPANPEVDLRAVLQSDLGLRAVALSGLSASLLSAAAQLRRGAGDRHDVRAGRRGRGGDVRRLALGLERRRLGQQLHHRQRQPRDQHQRQQLQRQQLPRRPVEARSGASRRRALSQSGRARAVQPDAAGRPAARPVPRPDGGPLPGGQRASRRATRAGSCSATQRPEARGSENARALRRRRSRRAGQSRRRSRPFVVGRSQLRPWRRRRVRARRRWFYGGGRR